MWSNIPFRIIIQNKTEFPNVFFHRQCRVFTSLCFRTRVGRHSRLPIVRLPAELSIVRRVNLTDISSRTRTLLRIQELVFRISVNRLSAKVSSAVFGMMEIPR